jgi:hypothetical protein
MPKFPVAVMAVLMFAPVMPVHAAAAQVSRFTYVGDMLRPKIGNGIQGVTNIQFTLTGRRPPKGKCEKHLTLETLFDGMYSPKILMAHGYMETPDSKVVVCSDPVTGKLTEKLFVNMQMLDQGVLVAGYTWISNDPKKGKSADVIESFENVEYHTSITRRAGHFSGRRVLGHGGQIQPAG